MSTDTLSGKPKHIGIIPDGNRRWAEKHRIGFESAYWFAMQKLAMCVEQFLMQDVLSVSAYLLSKNNLLRTRDDLEAIIQAELRLCDELLPPIKNKYGAKVYHAGNSGLLPDEYRSALNRLCEPGNGGNAPFPRVYLCAGYDPFEEVARSLVNMNLVPENIISHLSVPIELDMVIRTGGDIRLSGFLLLQCKYAEFFFEPYYFPDITEKHIDAILRVFCSRGRRFGK